MDGAAHRAAEAALVVRVRVRIQPTMTTTADHVGTRVAAGCCRLPIHVYRALVGVVVPPPVLLSL